MVSTAREGSRSVNELHHSHSTLSFVKVAHKHRSHTHNHYLSFVIYASSTTPRSPRRLLQIPFHSTTAFDSHLPNFRPHCFSSTNFQCTYFSRRAKRSDDSSWSASFSLISELGTKCVYCVSKQSSPILFLPVFDFKIDFQPWRRGDKYQVFGSERPQSGFAFLDSRSQKERGFERRCVQETAVGASHLSCTLPRLPI